jgi:hypothetical protein
LRGARAGLRNAALKDVTKRFVFPREILLVEAERRCREPSCGARVRLSLTKKEARAYKGFECGRCGRWFWDTLDGRDVPEWAEEFGLPAPEAVAPARAVAVGPVAKDTQKACAEAAWRAEEDAEAEEVSEVVARMSDAWRRAGGEPEAAPEVAETERGSSS